jgi:hypothetical protein
MDFRIQKANGVKRDGGSNLSIGGARTPILASDLACYTCAIQIQELFDERTAD